MPGTFADSWKLTKTSFRLIREDRALLIFPLVAGLSILGVLLLLTVGEFALFGGSIIGFHAGDAVTALGVVVFLAAYFGMVFLSVYCTAALIGAATLKLNGQQPTAADGWKIARGRLGRLVVWALLTATVGLLIQAISNRVRGLGGIMIGAIGGITWSVVTYFMVPVLLYEDERPWPALKRSARLFTSTLGRSLVSNLALGLMLGAGIVVGVVVGVVGLLYLVGGAVALGMTLIGVALAIVAFVALIGAAAEGVLRAALYRYATTGKIDPDLMPAGYRGTATTDPLP